MLLCGLEDQSFRPDPSSTRWQTPTKFQFVRDVTTFDGPVLFVDGHALTPDECDSPHKIAWLHEPPCLGEMHTVYSGIRDVADRYERVLTYDARLLAMDPAKYKLLPYGGCWVDESEWGMRPKSKLCSMLIGDKLSAPGHIMRRDVADKLAGRVDFYGTRGEIVGYERDTKLRVNGDYMFTVITETCRMDNLFTEWTLDPMSVGTIPIAWTAPNIGAYLDPRGILQFETAEECLEIVRVLTPALYESMLPFARANADLMKYFARPDDTILYEKYLKEYDESI